MDLAGDAVPIHIRTAAHLLVTPAGNTHLPEQQETIHMRHMLREEASSGVIDDLAHVLTAYSLADCLTKTTATPGDL